MADRNGVYNGKCKLLVQNRNFMMKNDVEQCMADLNSKKSEGLYRIPVCCLFDAGESLPKPHGIILIISGTVNPKRHEPKSYEAGNSAVGLFLKIYTCKHERTQ